jgi:hypothetical protein
MGGPNSSNGMSGSMHLGVGAGSTNTAP